MNVIEHIRDYILTKNEITSITNKVRMGQARSSDKKPYVTMFELDGETTNHMGGASGYRVSRLQVDLWTDNYSDLANLEEGFRNILSGYQGTLGGFQIYRTHMVPQTDRSEFLEGMNNQQMSWQKTIEFHFDYAVTEPTL
jgi:hypothetical protein